METVMQETIRENLDYREENRQLKEKVAHLEAEIAELKTPDKYTSSGNNVFTTFDTLEDALEADPEYEVFRVHRIKRLPDIFVAKIPNDEDGSDFEIIQRDTYREVEVAVTNLRGAE